MKKLPTWLDHKESLLCSVVCGSGESFLLVCDLTAKDSQEYNEKLKKVHVTAFHITREAHNILDYFNMDVHVMEIPAPSSVPCLWRLNAIFYDNLDRVSGLFRDLTLPNLPDICPKMEGLNLSGLWGQCLNFFFLYVTSQAGQ